VKTRPAFIGVIREIRGQDLIQAARFSLVSWWFNRAFLFGKTCLTTKPRRHQEKRRQDKALEQEQTELTEKILC
jgi:hypothetical protein